MRESYNLRNSRSPVDAVGLILLWRLLAGTYGIRFAISVIAVRWYHPCGRLRFWFVIDWWIFLFEREGRSILDTFRWNLRKCVPRYRMHEFLDENAMRATKYIMIRVVRCEYFALQMSMPTMHVRLKLSLSRCIYLLNNLACLKKIYFLEAYFDHDKTR